jgi:hypothetical protein
MILTDYSIRRKEKHANHGPTHSKKRETKRFYGWSTRVNLFMNMHILQTTSWNT